MAKQDQSIKTWEPVVLGTGLLTVEQVVAVARYGCPVAEIGDETQSDEAQKAYARVVASHTWVDEATKGNEERREAYYGINTGFGSKAGRQGLGMEDMPWVSRNLIVSHSTGVGDPLHPEVARAAMLIRANSLAQGYSGVRPVVVNTLVRMLNRGVCPVIPEYGSVGASGDLAPLSHLGLVMSERPDGGQPLDDLPDDYDESGKAYLVITEADSLEGVQEIVVIDHIKYGIFSGKQAMAQRQIERLTLGPKEGLAFNNGATFSAAISALAIYDAENVTRHAEIAAAISLEALLGFRDAFFPHIQRIRRHAGQMEMAKRILQIVDGSNLLDGSETEKPRCCPPQDGYSLRVTPQVIGAVWDVLKFLRRTIEEEINAATDNPSIFMELPRDYKSVSGGNFHGAPLAYAMDFLSIVMTDLGSLSERRTFRLTDGNLNQGLPSMLIKDLDDKPGRTSGLMIAQYLAAGLVSDCKTLSHPASVDSIPTSESQEDHVSMSLNAARHARKVVENIGYVVAIEILSGYIGLNWRITDLDDKCRGIGYKAGELPWEKEPKDRKRLDEVVKYLHDEKLSPQPGKGTLKALNIVTECLYKQGNSLPKWGDKPTGEDHFLQPYVLRIAKLLHERNLVREVYNAVGIAPVKEA